MSGRVVAAIGLSQNSTATHYYIKSFDKVIAIAAIDIQKG
jgi:hypothetical protein